MSDRPEIPPDLMQALIAEHRRHNYGPDPEPCDICAKLDALEQAPDPAEVAARVIWLECGTPSHHEARAASAIRQAHAERDKAVRELSHQAASRWPHGHEDNRNCPLCVANRRVRKLFRFDKEKP